MAWNPSAATIPWRDTRLSDDPAGDCRSRAACTGNSGGGLAPSLTQAAAGLGVLTPPLACSALMGPKQGPDGAGSPICGRSRRWRAGQEDGEMRPAIPAVEECAIREMRPVSWALTAGWSPASAHRRRVCPTPLASRGKNRAILIGYETESRNDSRTGATALRSPCRRAGAPKHSSCHR